MPGSTRIIPLGGLGEVGKNMTVYEADGEAVVVDAGLAFPRDEHLGVDLILPDFSYLADLGRPVRAILLTHGHEDHVGALPYVLREARVREVWATRLTLGLVKSKLDEHGLLRAAELREDDAINQLARRGAEVLHQEIAPVHVSGHGNAEELRTMIGLVRPKAVMPVHGEFRMLAAHARLAREGGVPEEQIVLAENGSVGELTADWARRGDHVESGVTFVDGLGVGDVQDVALRDRRHLSEDGVLIVVATLAGTNGSVAGRPELIARGFAEPDESLLEEMREEAQRVLDDLVDDNVTEIKLLQEHLHDGLGQLIYDRTGRRPMILPVVVEV